MAAATVKAVLGGIEGRVAGIGDVQYQGLTIVYVLGGGVNQAAVGNQLRLRPRDHRHLTIGCTCRRVGEPGLGTSSHGGARLEAPKSVSKTTVVSRRR